MRYDREKVLYSFSTTALVLSVNSLLKCLKFLLRSLCMNLIGSCISEIPLDNFAHLITVIAELSKSSCRVAVDWCGKSLHSFISWCVTVVVRRSIAVASLSASLSTLHILVGTCKDVLVVFGLAVIECGEKGWGEFGRVLRSSILILERTVEFAEKEPASDNPTVVLRAESCMLRFCINNSLPRSLSQSQVMASRRAASVSDFKSWAVFLSFFLSFFKSSFNERLAALALRLKLSTLGL